MSDFIISGTMNDEITDEQASHTLDAEAQTFADNNNIASFERIETYRTPFDLHANRTKRAARYRVTKTRGAE